MSKWKKVLSANINKVIGIIFGSLIGLIIVMHIILNIVFGIQLRNKIAELKAEGRPMTIAEIVPPSVPDKENAAVLYNNAFILMTTGEGGKPYIPNKEGGTKNKAIKTITDIKSFSDISEWTEEQRREIPELVNSRDTQYIYELLEGGSRKPKCNFNPEYEKGFDMRFPHLSLMRDAEKLLCVKALLEAESGNAKEAFDTLLVGLKFSNHLKYEPILISQLVRIACDGMIIECIKGISDSKGISVEKATSIMNELSVHKGIEPFIKCMDGERLFGGWFFERILKGKMSLREIGNITGGGNGEYPLTLVEETLLSLMSSPIYRPVFKKDFVCYLTFMSKMRDKYNLPYYETTKEISIEQQVEELPRYYILTKMLTPALEGVRGTAAEYQANIDVCRVGLALKLYKVKNGGHPEELKSLVSEFLKEIPIDPCTGKSLVYSSYIGGFKLYSFGRNKKDDYGTPKAKERIAPANKDYDIVWKSES